MNFDTFEGDILRVSSRDRYLRKASECVRAFERMRDPIERAALLQIAKAFMNLAGHARNRHVYGVTHRGTEPDPERYSADA